MYHTNAKCTAYDTFLTTLSHILLILNKFNKLKYLFITFTNFSK